MNATCDGSYYRDRQLRAVIDTYRSRHGDMLTITGLADRLDNLAQALDAAPSLPATPKCAYELRKSGQMASR